MAGAPEIVVRACCSFEDCDAVAALCGSSFPEEVYSQGLSVQQWAQIEAEDLKRVVSWWRQIGLAREGGTNGPLLGVVVLTLEHEADDSISWSEYSRRVGCGPTVLSWCYDHVLDETLLEHECLIDFIAVAPEARGKGVGAKLMQWAEQAGAAILADTETAAVAAHGVDMTLWVAADNAVAFRLYQRSGYAVVKRTDSGACYCLASLVLKWFLGHPVWIKMRKQLPVPEHLAAHKPEQQSIPLSVTAGATSCSTLFGTAADEDAPFVDVPLGPSPATEQAPRSPPGWSRATRLARPAAVPVGAPAPVSVAAALRGTSGSSVAQKQASLKAGQQPLTPKIAAVGSGLQTVHMELQPVEGANPAGGSRLSNQDLEGQFVQLHAASITIVQSDGGAAHLVAAPAVEKLAVLNPAALAAAAQQQPGAVPSVASASVASLAEVSDDDSDSEADKRVAGAVGAGAPAVMSALVQHGMVDSTAADVFELVSLWTDSATAPAAVPA